MQLNYEQQLDYIKANGVELSQSRYGIIYAGRLHIIYDGEIFDSRSTITLTHNDFELLKIISEKEEERLIQKAIVTLDQVISENE